MADSGGYYITLRHEIGLLLSRADTSYSEVLKTKDADEGMTNLKTSTNSYYTHLLTKSTTYTEGKSLQR